MEPDVAAGKIHRVELGRCDADAASPPGVPEGDHRIPLGRRVCDVSPMDCPWLGACPAVVGDERGAGSDGGGAHDPRHGLLDRKWIAHRFSVSSLILG